MASILQSFLSMLQPSPPAAPIATDLSQEEYMSRQNDDSDNFFLLDCRTSQEFAGGHIKGACNISHGDVGSRLSEIPKDKDVIMYCRSGRRVSVIARVLAANDYSRLFHIDGDMTAWLRNSRPVSND